MGTNTPAMMTDCFYFRQKKARYRGAGFSKELL